MAIKHVSLVVLTVQNSVLMLTMRYSRVLPGPRYRATTAVLLSECLKTILAFTILISIKDRGEPDLLPARPEKPSSNLSSELPQSKRRLSCAVTDIFSRRHGFFSMMIPAILYTIQNNLQYVAATNLDAATFQVTYQGKILATAFFAALILRQKLNGQKWGAIIILTAGVILISYPSTSTTKSVWQRQQENRRMAGLMAVSAACLTSGFAGVYLEYLLKKVKDNQTQSGLSLVWIRNVQLCLAGILVAAIVAAMVDGAAIWHDGFFHGYNQVVWITILLQAGGGIVVALVIIYADNILKNFATTISTVISTIVSVGTGDCILTRNFIGGAVLVLVATNLYGAGSCLNKSHHERERDETTASQLKKAAESSLARSRPAEDCIKTERVGLLSIEQSHEI